MQCPSCVQRIHRGAESCPHCGFTLKVADDFFRYEALPTGLLEDTAGILRRIDLHRIEVAMERFRRLFPQLFFAINIRSFRVPKDLQMFGFWLLNHAKFRDQNQPLKNENGILLVMDAESKQAGLTFGYTLDSYLDKTDTYACLSKAHSSWVNQLFADGVIALLVHLEKVLIRKHRSHRSDANVTPHQCLTPRVRGEIPPPLSRDLPNDLSNDTPHVE